MCWDHVRIRLPLAPLHTDLLPHFLNYSVSLSLSPCLSPSLSLSTLPICPSAKLAVTTSSRHTTGSGPVVVETVSGGVGKSSVTFTFTGTECGQPPEVTGISPREGSVDGNQRVVLRGSNLGESKSDVVKVMIAGVDCTSTLEYFSPGE